MVLLKWLLNIKLFNHYQQRQGKGKGKKCSNNWLHSAVFSLWLTLCGCTIRTTWPLCVHIFRNGAWAASGGTWGIIELWGRGMMGRWWGGRADCLRRNAARGCWHNWEFWERQKWWFRSKAMFKSVNILLMLVGPNFKEQKKTNNGYNACTAEG